MQVCSALNVKIYPKTILTFAHNKYGHNYKNESNCITNKMRHKMLLRAHFSRPLAVIGPGTLAPLIQPKGIFGTVAKCNNIAAWH